ncbi:hypothetical protein [Jannaschia rubra]|uniref:hypothetical protein n=1 Tax=Jannaschia rubra TaxID=282197 RepID=UPI0024937451|nr:hypothetical protein [Jannaschia rubra]
MTDRTPYVALTISAEEAAQLEAIILAVTKFHAAVSHAFHDMVEAKGTDEALEIARQATGGAIQANVRMGQLHGILNGAQGVFGGPIQ